MRVHLRSTLKRSKKRNNSRFAGQNFWAEPGVVERADLQSGPNQGAVKGRTQGEFSSTGGCGGIRHFSLHKVCAAAVLQRRHRKGVQMFGAPFVFSSQYPVPSTQYPVLSTQYPVPSTQYSVLGTQYSECKKQGRHGAGLWFFLGTGYWVLGTGY